MSKTDPHQIWGKLIERATNEGESSLSTEELAICKTAYLLFLLENGGLFGFLYNVGPTTDNENNWAGLSENIDTLKFVGCDKPAKVLEKLLSIIQSNPNPSTTPWGEYLELANTQGEITELEKELFAMIPTTYEDLERYTERYKSG